MVIIIYTVWLFQLLTGMLATLHNTKCTSGHILWQIYCIVHGTGLFSWTASSSHVLINCVHSCI